MKWALLVLAGCHAPLLTDDAKRFDNGQLYVTTQCTELRDCLGEATRLCPGGFDTEYYGESPYTSGTAKHVLSYICRTYYNPKVRN